MVLLVINTRFTKINNAFQNLRKYIRKLVQSMNQVSKQNKAEVWIKIFETDPYLS